MKDSDEAIAQVVRTFHERAVETEAVMDALNEQMKMAPEAPLSQAVYGLLGLWMNELQVRHGLGDWLEWWWLECALGEHPMKAGLPGQPLRTIATLDDLTALILDDRATAG